MLDLAVPIAAINTVDGTIITTQHPDPGCQKITSDKHQLLSLDKHKGKVEAKMQTVVLTMCIF